ncbi:MULTISPECIES: hypothetical protein [unclassified Halomonas]|uniref:hypothetical protein n=1 Tax=unclassified Halomonas TaxID=2609666 RepID=UPI0004BA557D|nr:MULTISPECIES: hypothetical protein [unclassified Halomonas]
MQTSHYNSAFFLNDIDEELEGWEDGDDLLAEVDILGRAPQALPATDTHKREPP